MIEMNVINKKMYLKKPICLVLHSWEYSQLCAHMYGLHVNKNNNSIKCENSCESKLVLRASEFPQIGIRCIIL